MKRNKILQFYRVTPFLSSSCLTRRLTIAETGRSIVEMLGTLAIIGVLSIGGIMGYSYGMNKYHANEVINNVNMRMIDVVSYVMRGSQIDELDAA